MKRIFTTLLTTLFVGFAGAVHAQQFPTKPIRLLSPFPAGGQTDILARTIASALGPVLGQPVIVEQKLGGNGVVGAAYVSKQPADGYTLFISNAGLITIYPSVDADLPFNPTRDFTPLITLAGGPVVLESSAKVPVKSLPELLALSKTRPGGLSIANSGLATVPGLLSEQFRAQSGMQWTPVSYKGSGPKMTDLIGGQVDFTFDNLAASIEYIRAGQFRALAISKHNKTLPDVKTFKELGFDIEDALAWHALLVPKGTPPEIVARLNAEINKILQRPEIVQKLEQIGLEVIGGTPAESSAFVASETVRWGKIANQAGLKSID